MDQLSQIHAIIDRLAGRPGVRLPMPAELDEPWRTIYTRVQKAGDFSNAEKQLIQDSPSPTAPRPGRAAASWSWTRRARRSCCRSGPAPGALTATASSWCCRRARASRSTSRPAPARRRCASAATTSSPSW